MIHDMGEERDPLRFAAGSNVRKLRDQGPRARRRRLRAGPLLLRADQRTTTPRRSS